MTTLTTILAGRHDSSSEQFRSFRKTDHSESAMVDWRIALRLYRDQLYRPADAERAGAAIEDAVLLEQLGLGPDCHLFPCRVRVDADGFRTRSRLARNAARASVDGQLVFTGGGRHLGSGRAQELHVLPVFVGLRGS